MTSNNEYASTRHSRPTLWARLCGVFMLAIWLLTAICCTEHEHSRFHAIAPYGWLYADTITMQLCDSDSVSMHRGDIAIALRHSSKYEYSNIWLEMSYHGRDSILTDTFNLVLADDLGNWYGSGMGISYQYIDTVLRNVVLDVNHPIMIKHIMRTDTLEGIEQIGVIFNDKNTQRND